MMNNEVKEYEINGKLVSIETLEAFWRIYCAHSCLPEECKVYTECKNIEKITL